MVDYVGQDVVKGDGDAMDDGVRMKRSDGKMMVDDECCCSHSMLLPIHWKQLNS